VTSGCVLRAGLVLVTGLALAGGRPLASPADTFADVSAGAGIRFVHHNGAQGQFLYPELFGGGVAVLDLEGDQWPDLLFVDGRDWAAGGRPARHALYRNNRDGTFTDVAAARGLDRVNVYGLGAAVADYDNDGRDDVYLTSATGGRLLRNTPAGFVDETTRAAVTDPGFAVAAAWLDYDRDGLADLLVGRYVRWSAAAEPRCAQQGIRGYCGPDAYPPTAPVLFRNRGGGRFEDVTALVGLDDPTDKVMGIAVVDVDRDGWPDVFLGSDRVPAKLYRNEGGKRFRDIGLAAGIALSEMGLARANMGVDAADYDRSGWPSIAVGNFTGEMLGLYQNTGRGRVFVDRAPRSAVGRASLPFVTWAVMFFDADLDGWPDLLAINGGTDESQARDQRARVAQPPLLLRNRGDGTFADVTAAAGTSFSRPAMGRGAAYADLDGDGDLDLAIARLAGPAALFRNDAANGHHWLRVRAIGSQSTRSGLGTVVTVTSASGAQWQTVKSGSSYASQSELTLTFGLARDTVVTTLDVRWPSGRTQRFPNVSVDREVIVDETRGLLVTGRPARGSGPRPAPPR